MGERYGYRDRAVCWDRDLYWIGKPADPDMGITAGVELWRDVHQRTDASPLERGPRIGP